MGKVKTFSEFVKEDLITENHSEQFGISNKKLKKYSGNSTTGIRNGEIDSVIKVFAYQDHLKHAKELYEALKAAGLEDKYFGIEISPK